MEEMIGNSIQVWLSILVSQCYCFVIGKIVSKGFKRLVLYVPIICIFLVVPLMTSSINLCAVAAFFITFLGTLKLLLFAFGKGAMSLDPQISLSQFLLISCLPIDISQNPNDQKLPKHFAIKVLGTAILYPPLCYKEHFDPNFNLVILCVMTYLFLEVTLVTTAIVAQAIVDQKLEPHFNEPYLATSIQDFWGKRWNLIVSRTLRQSIYEPGVHLWTGVVGRKWAPVPAAFWTFVVSGLFHELMFFYFARVTPTWEVTWFFVLHGTCVAVEIAVKKASVVKWHVPTAVSRPATIGFVICSMSWLFFPQFLRCKADVRMAQELSSLGLAFNHEMYKLFNYLF